MLLGLPAYAFSLFTILGLSTIAISDPILAKDVTLDCSKACICFVHRSRHIYFTSWLNNIDEFRCSTAEIASFTTMFWTLSTILCQVYAFSLFTILGLSTIAISDPILAKDVTLDCSKACICFVHRSRHIYFTSWLNNIDEFRCSTAEIASFTTMFWTLSTILCQVYAGYLYHHPSSETQQTGYSMEVTVSLR